MVRRMLVVALTLLAFVAGLEVVCRALPVSSSTETGYYIDPDILTYPARFEWTVSTGWDLRNAQRMRSNNLGFAAHRDFVPDPSAVILIGDSYVEASMLAPSSRPGPQLELALGGTRPVYAMGGPGSSLLDYADRVRYARDRLGARSFVLFLERSDLRQSICGSGNVHSACLAAGTLTPRRERLPAPSAIKRVVRHSAFAQYLFSQLKLKPEALLARWPAAAAPAASAGSIGVSALSPQARQAVLVEFLSRLGPASGYDRVVFVVDGRHAPTRDAIDTTLQAERLGLMEGVRAWGATVVDTEPVYARHQARSKRSLEVGPFDRHLNALGVQLVMQAAADSMR